MKSNYSAYLQGKTLSICKQQSGEKVVIAITTITKDQRFYIDGTKVKHDFYLIRDGMIYLAPSEEEAQQVLQQINFALRGRARDISRCWKMAASALIGASVAIAIVSAWYLGKSSSAGLNEQPVAMAPSTQSKYAEALTFNPSVMTIQPTPVVPSSGTPSPMLNTESQTPPPAIADYQATSRRLNDAASSGRYTIPLSTGHARTLYVFSDPLCPNCKVIEPALEAISQSYNVEIFPVTLKGRLQTVKIVSPILCRPKQERKELWKKLYKADAGISPVDEKVQLNACATGDHAIAINDRAFDIYNLPGTPSILADDGRYIPLENLKSDSVLRAFLNTPL
jgi:TrbB protein